MKYKVILILLLVSLLGACSAPTPDQVILELRAGVDTVEVNGEFVDAGVKATVYGLPIKVTIIENTVDLTKLGTYSITYEVDYRGIIKSVTRYVFVIDETAPTGVLNPGIDTVYVNTTWVDAYIEASDNSNEPVLIETTGSVDTTTIGEYLITYTVSDSSGNIAIYYRYVSVISNPNQ